MCRSIKPLYHLDPPASPDEIRAAALQFIRKISGYQKPSQVNEAAFEKAVDAVTLASIELMASLKTQAPPRSRSKPRSQR